MKSFVVAMVILASPGLADLIVPGSQTRFVQNEFTQINAPDFAPFDQSVTGASQSSTISSNSIDAVGSVFTNDDLRHPLSSLDVTFTLTENASYTITGRLDGSFSTANAIANMKLEAVGGPTIHDLVTSGVGPPGPSINLNLAGVLAAGTYRIMAAVSGNNGDPIGGSSSGQFRVLFSVPEPASLTLLALAGLLVARRAVRD